jgi:6-phosphogluconolactonase
MNLRIFDDAPSLVSATARLLVQRAQASPAGLSIALSGGSTPQPLYTMLGEGELRETLAAIPITWVVVDERFVPLSDPRSNAAMIERTLFANGMSPAHRFLPFRTDVADAEASATAFAREWETLGLGDLDVVLLGMGDDGHTASLFPGTAVLEVEDRVAAAVYVPAVSMWRVTITKPVIRAAALRIVLAAGASKSEVIAHVRAGEGHYPIVEATAGAAGETWWMLDRAAAGE